MPYTHEERQAALTQLKRRNYDYEQTSADTGVSRRTLKRWHDDARTKQLDALQEKIEDLHAQLAENALHLAQALDDSIDGAPLNQVSSALGVVVDRFLKVDDHIAQVKQAENETNEQVIRIEYQYPDSTIHHAPPWANPDYQPSGEVQGGGLREALRQDGDGEADSAGESPKRRDVLVARPDLSNGNRRVARAQDDYPHASAGGA